MKKLELIRTYLPDRTIGVISADGYTINTLERPWDDNKVNVSCIPEGSYIVKRDTTGKHQWFSIQDVSGRTFIEMHGGTIPTHSDGCILVGSGFYDNYNLKDSAAGLGALLRRVRDNDFMLTIRAAKAGDWSEYECL